MDNTEANLDPFPQSLRNVVKTLRDISPRCQKSMHATG